jgi:hypothetical protein
MDCETIDKDTWAQTLSCQIGSGSPAIVDEWMRLDGKMNGDEPVDQMMHCHLPDQWRESDGKPTKKSGLVKFSDPTKNVEWREEKKKGGQQKHMWIN